jgi:hypothetical protein
MEFKMVMEHRWGERMTVDLAVRLRSPVGGIAMGQMVDVSRSGAFIRTELGLEFAVRIDILLSSDEVPAFVVRNASDGVGVEWCGAVPDVITALVRPSKAQHHGVTVTRRR